MNLIYLYFRAEDTAAYTVDGQRILKSYSPIVGTEVERGLGTLPNSWDSQWVVEAADCVGPVFEFHLSDGEHGEMKK